MTEIEKVWYLRCFRNQKSWARPMTCDNEYLYVELCGGGGDDTLSNMLKFPTPLWQQNIRWRHGKNGGIKRWVLCGERLNCVGVQGLNYYCWRPFPSARPTAPWGCVYVSGPCYHQGPCLGPGPCSQGYVDVWGPYYHGNLCTCTLSMLLPEALLIMVAYSSEEGCVGVPGLHCHQRPWSLHNTLQKLY